MSTRNSELNPNTLMGGQNGIYFTFLSDINAISEVVPEPLKIAFPLISGYVINIDKPTFSEPYREAMLGAYVKFNNTIGMYPISFLLSGKGAEMATYLGREKSGLSKKMCEREDCIKITHNENMLHGTVIRKGVLLLDIKLELGRYNNSKVGDIYQNPEANKEIHGTSFYFATTLEPDKNGESYFSNVNMYSNEAIYTYRKWEQGKVSIQLHSSKNDKWGRFPVIENMGGAYSENDLLMKKLYVVAKPNPQNVISKLLINRFDNDSLV